MEARVTPSAEHYASLPEGLSQAEAEARLQRFGPNSLPAPRRSAWRLVLRQFQNVLVYILLAALALSIAMPMLSGEPLRASSFLDAFAILAILLVNAGLGFFQEFKADEAIRGLQQLSAPRSRVRRAGVERMIPSRDLVPGDIVVLSTGDRIAADAWVWRAEHLQVDEASLTGESEPVSKRPKDLSHLGAGRQATVYAGTLVTRGSAEVIVTATGMASEMGRIAALMTTTALPETPLQRRLVQLSKGIGRLVLLVCGLVLVLMLRSGMPLADGLLVAVSLAVSAVPEGLTAVVTASFAIGVRRMAKRNALVRRLDALETLGSVTVICSDKTGTITRNQMHVAEIWTPEADDRVSGGVPDDGEAVARLLRIAASCNTAALPDLGDPTELGLLRCARERGIERLPIDLVELPFSAENRHMRTRHGDQRFIKGAPETVVALCPAADQRAYGEALDGFTGRGLRVLAFAEASGSEPRLVGLIGLEDPPREGAAAAIAEARRAGIRTIMMTGDNGRTARAIAASVGLQDGAAVLGEELAQMSDEALEDCAAKRAVFARVSPEHKLRLLQALQRRGEVVAMTGDGVNDAPALKGAHVGIAMGRDGTEVAREAASIVLADDHYASIVAAVREGRRIYDNIRRFVLFLLRANLGELIFITTALLLGMPLPYLPLHILWINLMTDGLPALALAAEQAEAGIMRKPPRVQSEPLLSGQWGSLIGVALLAFGLAMSVFSRSLDQGLPLEEARTLTLTTAMLFELCIAFSMRSRRPLWEIGPWSNPWMIGAAALPLALQIILLNTPLVTVFRLVPLSLKQWGIAAGAALSGLLFLEVSKWFGAKHRAGRIERRNERPEPGKGS